ncbi:MAG: VCBS domain-containing protein, partial [Verrucomicrobiota bacterium]|nr:VCBS domain-containing protein [Verrucomicrobiota bacterium]
MPAAYVDVAAIGVYTAPANTAPTAISLSTLTVTENVEAAVIGDLTVTDADVGDSHTYTVDDARFVVDGGQLKLAAGVSLDFEAEPSVTVNVTATDTGGLPFIQPFTISVTNDPGDDQPDDNVITVSTEAASNWGGQAGTYLVATTGEHGSEIVTLTELVVTDPGGGGALTYTYTAAPPVTLDAGASSGILAALHDGDPATLPAAYVDVAAIGAYTAPANDPATFTGDSSGAVTEDAVQTVSGDLDVTDVDGADTFTPQTDAAVDYGTFSIDADGNWTFVLDNAHAAVQALGVEDDPLIQTVTVTAADDTAHDITITINGADDVISGHAIDGYIEGATVFADADGDRQWDEGEATAVTGTDGTYTLTNAEGRLVLKGGDGAIDAATGLTFKGSLEAPEGSSVVTPVTTLINKLIDGENWSTDYDLAAADAKVRSALGLGDDIDGSIDLTAFDPVASALSDTPSTALMGAEMARQGVVFENIIVQAAAVIRGADSTDTVSWGVATSAVFRAIAHEIDSMAGDDGLSDTVETFAGLINGAAGLVLPVAGDQAAVTAAAGDVAGIILAGMTSLKTATEAIEDADTFDPVAYLTALAKSAVVSQAAAAGDIEAAVDAGDTSWLASSYSGAVLQTK